ncbi:M3 family metallopeptidase [Thermodesulfobacteriota bacterium]
MHQENYAKGITWDMAEISFPLQSGNWEETMEAAEKMALLLVDSLKGKFFGEKIDPRLILAAIKEYEFINELCRGPYLNAFLYKSSNVLDEKRNALFNTIKERTEQIYDILMPLELEFRSLSDRALKELAECPELKAYRYMILRQIRYKRHVLSESEEMSLKSKNISNRLGPISRFVELTANLSFIRKIRGNDVNISISEALRLLSSPERTVRESVFKGFMGSLEKHGDTFQDVLNILIQEKNDKSDFRGYPSSFHMSIDRNDIEPTLVDSMIEFVEKKYSLVSRYYSFKSRLMGIDDFKIFDISVPIKENPSFFTFREARQIILETLDEFHPDFGSAARDIFSGRLVDAEVREGKQNGAFCKCYTPSQLPYISLKYTGSIRSVFELAHEIGHGIQYVLSAGKSYLNFRPLPVVSETASTFVETLVSKNILKNVQFRKVRDEILSSVIESIILTVFRQNLITVFEKSIYGIRKRKALDAKELGKIWLQENRRLYSDAVELLPEYKWGWAYIPHIIHHSFYCYSYVLGSLVSFFLIREYEKKKSFAEDVVSFFESGSTESPVNLLKSIGVDMERSESCGAFFEYFEELINSLDGFNK